MDPKTVLQQFWADYEKGDLDHTWDAYVAPDLVIHPSSGYELTRATSRRRGRPGSAGSVRCPRRAGAGRRRCR